MKFSSIIGIGALALFACACSDSPEATGVEEEQPQVPEAPITYEFSAEQSRAAEASIPFMEKFWLVAEAQMGSEENYIVSPLSADILLSMVANTSTGALGEEIVAALGCSDKTVLNELASKYTVALPTIDDQIILGIYNSVWYRNNFRLNTTFGAKMEYYYNAEVTGHPFDNTLINAVNGWCNEKTRGLIPRIIYGVPDEAVMLLADAIYLKGAWANPFKEENTADAEFHGVKGESTVKMMSAIGPQHYCKGDNFQAVRMELGDGAIEAVFILPDEGEDMGGFLSENVEAIRDARFRDGTVEFYLPRFKFVSEEMDLNTMLANAGIPSVENGDPSDVLIGCPVLYHHIYQRTSLEFDEKGAEGAAVTWDFPVGAAGPEVEAEPDPIPVVRCDRPFYVLVRVAETGAPLFAGRINNL